MTAKPKHEPMQTVMIKVAELKPNPDNPRVNTSAVSATAESIRLFGFRVPIVVNADRMILAGHTRYRAAVSLKLDEVPCLDASDLTPDEQAAFAIAENRTSDFAFFDLPRLADVAATIDPSLLAGFDLDALIGAPEEETTFVNATENPEKRRGLDLAPFERYQYVMIMCRTEFDYTNLLAMLELQDLQKRYVDGALKQGTSTGRVIEYPDFMDRIRKAEQS